MKSLSIGLLVTSSAIASACAGPAPSDCGAPPSVRSSPGAPGGITHPADLLAVGGLRIVNRQVAPISGGAGVRVTAAPGVGLIWIKDSDFGEGTIEVDVCGRDVDQESFVGIAFHGVDDKSYEAVYLRPFNFRSNSADRRNHAVQYIAEPDYGYARLRQTFPNEFEHSVDPSIAPTAWIHLRIAVRASRVRAFVGPGDLPVLDVRELHAATNGQVGLFIDNGSDGVFANLRMAHGS